MKISPVALALILIFSPISSQAGEKWTKSDIAFEVAWQIINGMDWRQTIQISRNPDKYQEMENTAVYFLGGRHPSEQVVNVYFLGAALLHPLATHFLPKRWTVWGLNIPTRDIWLGLSIGNSTKLVVNNFTIGLGVRF